MMLNKKAEVWGTEYDSSADLFKVDLHVEKTAVPVETMKISLIPQENKHVRLLIEWEYYKAWTEVEIR